MRQLLASLLLLYGSTLAQQEEVSQWDEPGGNIRIQVRKVPDRPGIADVAVIGRQDVGWVGFGFGTQMLGSDMAMCWANGQTSATLKQYRGTPEGVQEVESVLQLNVQESRIWAPGNFVCRFMIRLPENTRDLMWATGDTRPTAGTGSPRSHSPATRGAFQHDMFSIIEMDMLAVSDNAGNSRLQGEEGERSNPETADGFIGEEEKVQKKDKSSNRRASLSVAVLFIASLFLC